MAFLGHFVQRNGNATRINYKHNKYGKHKSITY